jgi:mitochondrial fission protein ELM1
MITVWCVTDDKPGHKNQLLGLINALSQHIKLDCHWLSINEKASWPLSSRPSLIIAAGSRTHFSALTLRWRFGGKLVLLMKPFLPLRLFDLCLIPQHDGVPSSKRVVTTLGAINPVPYSDQSDSKRGLVLIGGPSSHYGWSDSDMIEQLLQLMNDSESIHWTLTTSRRTPNTFLPTLEAALVRDGNSQDIEVVPLEQTDGDWLMAHYQNCGVIWVSEDSVSMVYESLSSGAQTGILSVPRLRENRVSRGLDQLKADGRVRQLGIESKIGENQSPLREADKAASIIVERLL